MPDKTPSQDPHADVCAYVAGTLSPERALELERLAEEDSELAAHMNVISMLIDSTMEGDSEPLAQVAHALGRPLDDFMVGGYDTVALTTFSLLNGAVTREEADAYACYREATDQAGSAPIVDVLDLSGVQAVVNAKIFPDELSAEQAIWKVARALEPIIAQLVAESGDAV